MMQAQPGVVEPQAASPIRGDQRHVREPAGERGRVVTPLLVEPGQPVAARHPHPSALVGVQRGDLAAVGDRRQPIGGAAGEEQQRIGGHHPDALRRRLDAADQAEALDRPGDVARQAVEPVEGASPDVAVAVLEDRHDTVAEQSGRGRRLLDQRAVVAAERHPPQPLAAGADPEVAGAIVEEPLPARDLGGGEPAPLPEPPLEAVDAVGTPDAAAGVDAEPAHRVVRPAALTEWREALTVVALAGNDHVVAGADEQPSARIDGQGVHLGSGAWERPARPPTGVVAEEPAQMPQPHPAVDVLDQRASRADGEAARRAVFGEERETAAALDPVAAARRRSRRARPRARRPA